MNDIQHLPDSVAKALTRFEQAVSLQSYHETVIEFNGETDDESYKESVAEYKEARAALIDILEQVA